MSLRVVLGVVTSISAVITCLVGLSTIADPLGTAARFGVELADDPVLRTVLLTLAAAVLSLGLFTGLAARWVFLDRPEGRPLVLLCAGSLLLVAALGGVVGASRSILVLDGVRGTVLLVLGALWTPGAVRGGNPGGGAAP
jgi:hypothetical protein